MRPIAEPSSSSTSPVPSSLTPVRQPPAVGLQAHNNMNSHYHWQHKSYKQQAHNNTHNTVTITDSTSSKHTTTRTHLNCYVHTSYTHRTQYIRTTQKLRRYNTTPKADLVIMGSKSPEIPKDDARLRRVVVVVALPSPSPTDASASSTAIIRSFTAATRADTDDICSVTDAHREL